MSQRLRATRSAQEAHRRSLVTVWRWMLGLGQGVFFLLQCLLMRWEFHSCILWLELRTESTSWYLGSEICAAKLLPQTVLLLRHQHRGSDPDWSLDMLFENDYWYTQSYTKQHDTIIHQTTWPNNKMVAWTLAHCLPTNVFSSIHWGVWKDLQAGASYLGSPESDIRGLPRVQRGPHSYLQCDLCTFSHSRNEYLVSGRLPQACSKWPVSGLVLSPHRVWPSATVEDKGSGLTDRTGSGTLGQIKAVDIS